MPNRRDFFKLALAALHAEYSQGRPVDNRAVDPLAPRAPHHTPRAKSIIFLFMDGGVSHIDSFDPKPRVDKETGLPLPLARPKMVRAVSNSLLASPFEFRQYGQCGAPVSSLFPEVAQHVDDLCIIRSMVADHSEHT